MADSVLDGAVSAQNTVTKQTDLALTDSQRARVERNRQRALLLRQSRLSSRPYTTDGSHRKRAKIGKKPIDTGGGFLIEEDEEGEMEQKIVHPPAAVVGGDFIICEECEKEFMDSFLYTTFDLSVCDNCRNTEDKHKYITKSDAKERFLLKDCDIDKREPILKYIVKRNPRNNRWGSMKLYLESQISERALEVWESEEAMETEREKRLENKQKGKVKKFDKRMKDLRMSVRGSLWRKKTEGHEHTYGEETYNEGDDNYSKTCTTCQHMMTFEKM